MTLEDKDIIQVDATVIIGVMILLTLSIGFDSSIISQGSEYYQVDDHVGNNSAVHSLCSASHHDKLDE